MQNEMKLGVRYGVLVRNGVFVTGAVLSFGVGAHG